VKIPYVIEIDLATVMRLDGALSVPGVDTVIVLRNDPGAPTGMTATVFSAEQPVYLDIRVDKPGLGPQKPQN